MSVSDLLPPFGLPAAREPANVELEWFDMDTADRYQANGGHPHYGEHDIRYRLNSLGYRSPKFDCATDLRVLVVGCSYVFGVGLPEEHIFHRRFADRLKACADASVVLWNLGSPGASNDYINRIMQLGVPYLDPHIVLVHFTHASRREYGSLQNKAVRYNPGWYPSELVDREIKGHFDALSSGLDDCLNLFRNYRSIASMMSERTWLFSTSDPQCLSMIAHHVDTTRYVGALEFLDRARDHLHPGSESHAALADRYWERYSRLREAKVNESVRATVSVTATSASVFMPRSVPIGAIAELGGAGGRRAGFRAKLRGLLAYLDYRLRRRSRIKKAWERDPNIYPLW